MLRQPAPSARGGAAFGGAARGRFALPAAAAAVPRRAARAAVAAAAPPPPSASRDGGVASSSSSSPAAQPVPRRAGAAARLPAAAASAAVALCVSLAALGGGLLVAPPPASASDVGARAIAEFNELADKGKLKTAKQAEELRARYGLRRGYDGRVSLRSKAGDWFAARLDMEVPGAVLLRDPKGGVYALETDGLAQVDLSDDFVVFMMFADGDWEAEMQPVEVDDGGGKVAQLNMSEKEFREVVGILRDDEEEGGGSGKRK